MRKIRGHHLLCMAFFQGQGYDKRFVNNMTKVIVDLSEKDCSVLLTSRADDICSLCLHYDSKRGCLLGNDSVLLRDLKVLDKLQIQEDTVYCYADIVEKVRMLDKEAFEDICGSCRWFRQGLCSYELLKNKTGRNISPT